MSNSGKLIEELTEINNSEAFLKQPVGLAVAQPTGVSGHLKATESLEKAAPLVKSKLNVEPIKPKDNEAFVRQPACLSLKHQEQLSVCPNTNSNLQMPDICLGSYGLSFLQPSILSQLPVSTSPLAQQQFLPIMQMPLNYPPTFLLVNGTCHGMLSFNCLPL